MPLTLEFQLLDKQHTEDDSAVIYELVNLLGAVQFMATIICKAETDLVIANTAIQFPTPEAGALVEMRTFRGITGILGGGVPVEKKT